MTPALPGVSAEAKGTRKVAKINYLATSFLLNFLAYHAALAGIQTGNGDGRRSGLVLAMMGQSGRGAHHIACEQGWQPENARHVFKKLSFSEPVQRDQTPPNSCSTAPTGA
jgi:hypothetical protein